MVKITIGKKTEKNGWLETGKKNNEEYVIKPKKKSLLSKIDAVSGKILGRIEGTEKKIKNIKQKVKSSQTYKLAKKVNLIEKPKKKGKKGKQVMIKKSGLSASELMYGKSSNIPSWARIDNKNKKKGSNIPSWVDW